MVKEYKTLKAVDNLIKEGIAKGKRSNFYSLSARKKRSFTSQRFRKNAQA